MSKFTEQILAFENLFEKAVKFRSHLREKEEFFKLKGVPLGSSAFQEFEHAVIEMETIYREIEKNI